MNLEPGFLFAVPYEIVRPVSNGELWQGEELDNRYGNLYFAKPFNSPLDIMFIICVDGWTPTRMQRSHEMAEEILKVKR